MTDPVCTNAMHYFRQPVYDDEECLCQKTQYHPETSYHHIPDDDDPKPFNPLTDIITSPWAPLMESVLMSDDDSGISLPDFGGGSSGGAGAAGQW